MARKERYVVGLDVGTSQISVIVGEIMDEGSLDVIGIGRAESKGIRRGVVNNVDAAAESIKKALDDAELMAGVEIDSVHLSLSGAHVKAFNSRGVIAVGGRSREITREDVKRARSTPPAPWRCRLAARSCTCCRRTSWSTTSRAWPCRSG
jgi:cell division protein FtsA